MIELPCRVEGNLFFAQPRTLGGHTLRLWVDTAGGIYLFDDVVRRCELDVRTVEEDGETLRVACLPALDPSASIPPPNNALGSLVVRPAADRPPLLGGHDGMLGQAWFRGRTWTLDYPGRRLLLHPTRPANFDDSAHGLDLTMPGGDVDAGPDELPSAFASLAVGLADASGEDASLMLLDTGATVSLTPDAHAELDDDEPLVRATSFLEACLFDDLRHAHPTWRVVERADRISGEITHGVYEPMMEVPSVRIAGHTVGPVWFTRRRSVDFEWMSSLAACELVGALGGSGLHTFRVHLDYPSRRAVFDR